MYYQLTRNCLTEIKSYQKSTDFNGSSSYISNRGVLQKKIGVKTTCNNGYKPLKKTAHTPALQFIVKF
uniref:hypothetical protein n=1 Tax=Tenacibaculum piscium TaxID=1458515 RepID=UPI001F19495B